MSNIFLLCVDIAIKDIRQFDTVRLPIPALSTALCPYYIFVWPKLINYNREHCYCPVSPNSEYYHIFNECAKTCETEYDIEIVQDSISFHNVTKDFMAHFTCDLDPCVHTSCFLESIVSSNKIKVIGKSRTYVRAIKDIQLYN